MQARTALRGTGVVAVGAILLIASLPFEWVERDIKAPGGVAGLLLLLALAALVLAVIAAARSAAWPFLYARVLGACALVGTLYGVLYEGGAVRFGALLAGLGAAMITTGSSAGLSPEAVVERRSPR